MNAPDIDAVGYGLEIAPGRERRTIARRRRQRALLEEFSQESVVSSGDLAPEARVNQLELGETGARRLVERASVYIDRCQHAIAASLLRRVVREFPQNVNAWYFLGFALGEMGRRSESIECFLRAIEQSPSLAEAYANRGWQRLRSRNLPDAISDLKRATDLDPNSAIGWSHLGLALAKAGKTPEAVEAYRHSVFADSENGKTCFALASCLRRLGRREEAALYRGKALRLLARTREPKPSVPLTSDYQRHAVGRVLRRESLVEDPKEIRRQKQVQQALRIAQNPVAWMMFLILFLLLYVLLGK